MCPTGLEYRSCGPACHLSCQHVDNEPDLHCDKMTCVEGCFCPEGSYLQGMVTPLSEMHTLSLNTNTDTILL